MNKFLFLLLIANSAYGQICSDEMSSGPLSNFAGNNCLSETITKDDLTMELPVNAKGLCEDCNNPVLNKLLEDKEAQQNKRKAFGSFTLNEFQKELTFITIDLMKMRSSFVMDFDPKDSVSSCNFKKNLIKPSCLEGETSKEYDKQVETIQNSLATELANLIKPPADASEDGLFVRRPNKCNISDGDISNSHMRYSESLLTPEFISKLKQLQFPQGKEIKEVISNSDLKESFRELESHPLFKSLLNDKKIFNNFIHSIGKSDNSDQIVEKLYSAESAKNFEKSIISRCDNLFKKTSKYLDQIYCKKKPEYIANDAKAMEAVSNSTFSRMTSEKAENELRLYCSDINTKKKDVVSLSVIMDDLNKGNVRYLANMPYRDFKQDAYTYTYQNVGNNICAAKDEDCAKSSSSSCKLLHWYNTSKQSPDYQKLGKSSSENINGILRSMLGDGLPVKDGKQDVKSIALLRSEGILPGDESKIRPPQQDASTFHRTVKSNSTPAPTQAAVPAPKPAQPTSMNSNADYNSSAVANPSSVNNEDQSSSKANTATNSPSSRTYNPKNPFGSNLSDREQKELLDRMAKAKASKNSKNNNGSNNQAYEDEYQNGEPTSLPSSAIGSTQNAQPIDNTRVANNNANQFGNRKTNLDPSRKADSLNDAKIAANTNRSPSSEGSTNSSSAQVSLSKTADNENEIKIKVPDAELTKVNEFKNKLKDLLNAHGQELSMAKVGEKFVVKLNNYEINVVYNPKLKGYEAICKDASIPKDYLKTISTYFNENLKQGSGKLESLSNAFKG